MNDFVKWFQLNYPKLVGAMKSCSHHYDKQNLNPYHLEDDVWTHTMMVCQKAENESRHVQIAALLHDIGKVLTRKENHEKKRVSFFGHESMSAFLSLDILKELKLSDSQIVEIFQLICLHTEPFKLTEDELNKRLVFNIDLAEKLVRLNKVDGDGRFYDNESDREVFLSPQVSNDCNKKSSEVTFLVGLPCSGKSTFAKEADIVLSRDDLVEELGTGDTYLECWKTVDQKEVDKELQSRFRKLVKEGKSFTIDMTNLSRKSRRKWLNQLPACYSKKAVVLLTGLAELQKRNEAREGKTIPEDVIENMCKSFYPPMFDEFNTIEWRVSK